MHKIISKYYRLTINEKSLETMPMEDVTHIIERLKEENRQLKSELKKLKGKKNSSGLLSSKEAAEYIGVTTQTIYNLKDQGKFVLNRDYVLTKSGRPRYKIEALDEWLTGTRRKHLAIVS